MKITIDTEAGVLLKENGDEKESLPFYSRASFQILSREWLRVAWNEKYPYTFTWMGRPIIQLPDDMLRAQEVVWRLKPDVIIETGVAHGGSLVFYASLCALAGKGRVVGVDIEIRKQNRAAIEAHSMSRYITLVEGSSVDGHVVNTVKNFIRAGEGVLVFLDSCHSKDHVRRELEAYSEIVTPGSYLVATDGFMKDLSDVPRGTSSWKWDHPTAAAVEFAEAYPDFILEQPSWIFNESNGLCENVTYWPGAWLRKRTDTL